MVCDAMRCDGGCMRPREPGWWVGPVGGGQWAVGECSACLLRVPWRLAHSKRCAGTRTQGPEGSYHDLGRTGERMGRRTKRDRAQDTRGEAETTRPPPCMAAGMDWLCWMGCFPGGAPCIELYRKRHVPPQSLRI
jgi:hypothetical protein